MDKEEETFPLLEESSKGNQCIFLGLNKQQWITLISAWIGWGFDVLDGIIFNFVAPNVIPTLLGIPIGSAEAKREIMKWTGIQNSLLLIFWAIGGVVFGKLADIFGRSRILLITITLFAVATAACSASFNIYMLIVCRIFAALGIGGEWGAGAVLVQEALPERLRVLGGILLYTAAPFGIFFASIINYVICGLLMPDHPQYSWRIVFLCGILPAAVAFILRFFLKEPETWQKSRQFVYKTESTLENEGADELLKDDSKFLSSSGVASRSQKIWQIFLSSFEIFNSKYIYATYSGVTTALIGTLVWWSTNSFIAIIAAGLARERAYSLGLPSTATEEMIEKWKFIASNTFNAGGLLGVLTCFPVALLLGRRPLFAIYFGGSAASLFFVFGFQFHPFSRLLLYFLIGFFVFGIFGAYTFYLVELFPTRLRGMGASFCYNSGRIIAAAGPLLIGYISSQTTNAYESAIQSQYFVAFLALIGTVLASTIIETKNNALGES